MKKFYGLLALCVFLFGCSRDEVSMDTVSNNKITLEQWGANIDDMVFQNQVRLGQIEVKFKNGSRLVEFSPQRFVIMGSGMESCQDWMEWSRLRKEQWIMQLSVRGAGKLRCPLEGMFTMSFERVRVIKRPLNN